jgi:hypothetical protein
LTASADTAQPAAADAAEHPTDNGTESAAAGAVDEEIDGRIENHQNIADVAHLHRRK